MSDHAPRYGIYFAPEPASKLWTWGCGVLGYDGLSGADLDHEPPGGLARPLWQQLTHEPRRYGFHATLKAPFQLAHGQSEQALIAGVSRFAADHAAAAIAGLQVRELGSFVALVPTRAAPTLSTLAMAAVEAFEPFRAALSDADRARRLKAPLTPAQLANLERYGYPYVGEDFSFHMTLTGSAGPALRSQACAALAASYAEHVPASITSIDRIAVYHQASRSARFRIKAAFPLMGAGSALR